LLFQILNLYRYTAASRSMARLFRCMRVIEAATFGSQSCADAVVCGDLSPAPPSGVTGMLTLVPMRTNAAIASPAPKSAIATADAAAATAAVGAAAAAAAVAEPAEAEPDDAAALAAVVSQCRVDGIDLSPPAFPSGAGSKRRLKDEDKDEDDEAVVEKKFRTAEALLLTPSPNAKKDGGGGGVGMWGGGGGGDGGGVGASMRRTSGEGAHAFDAAMDAMASPVGGGAGGRGGGGGGAGGASNNDGKGGGGGGGGTPTFNFTHIAAAVNASIAWLDDGTEDLAAGGGGGAAGEGAGAAAAGGSGEGGSGCTEEAGAAAQWTMVHSLLRVLPTLAAAAAAATHATPAGTTICGVSVARDGGLGVDPRLAAGTLRSAVHVLTNLTNENPAGCEAVRAAGGLDAAAALVPWCASLEVGGCTS
jgi:pyruvate/2-oxoglutarate dehydrogenase complex dihydrolipoamide acyltransferase (E2) component